MCVCVCVCVCVLVCQIGLFGLIYFAYFPCKQCIDTYATDDWGNLINDKIERGPYYCMDPHGKRTGEVIRIFDDDMKPQTLNRPYYCCGALLNERVIRGAGTVGQPSVSGVPVFIQSCCMRIFKKLQQL